MKITQYCMRCGTQMELDFGHKKKRGKCPGCKMKFKYFESEDGALSYIYKTKDVHDLYVQCEEQDEKLVDIAKRNSEVMKLGTV